MGITNGDVARRACELAEISQGQLRMAALCVSAAAATTGTFPGARTALAVIAHAGLRDAAEQLLSELADGTAPAVPSASAGMAPAGMAAARMAAARMTAAPSRLGS